MQSTHFISDQESEPPPIHTQDHIGKKIFGLDTITRTDDLNVLDALRKGVRTSRNYLICKYISYDRLSPSYQAFVSTFDNVQMQIPNSIREALKDPD